MRCENIENLIAAYADGELDGMQKDLVKAHIEACPRCAELYREYLALNEALSACAERAPDDLCDKVMAAVQKEKAAAVKPMRGVRFGRAASFIGVGVAALLCISVVSSVIVKYMWQNGGAMEAPESQEPSWTQGGAFAPGEEGTMDSPTLEDAADEVEQESIAPADTDDDEKMDDVTAEPEAPGAVESTVPETTTEETTAEESTSALPDGGEHD